jgi:RHS repeat-associated protein
LVKVQYGNNTRSEFVYNGLNWRIVKEADTDANGSPDQQRFIFYSAAWQIVEERIDDDYPFPTDPAAADHERTMQYVWGLRYIDDLVLRREDGNFDGDYLDAEDTTWYHLTDAQFSPVAVIDDAGDLIERVSYDPYGSARHHWPADVDGDGDHDSTDRSTIAAIFQQYGPTVDISSSHYSADADLDRDGDVDSTDYSLSSGSNPALAKGELSAVDSIIGFSGYVYNAECALYLVRFRCYSTTLGRWLERDPLRYADSLGMYEYVRGRPLKWTSLSRTAGGLDTPSWNRPEA